MAKSLKRDDLISRIYSTSVKSVLVPTVILGNRVYIKTPKNAIVAAIRSNFKKDTETGLRFRMTKKLGGAIIDTVNMAAEAIDGKTQEDVVKVKRPVGRPRIHPLPQDHGTSASA